MNGASQRREAPEEHGRAHRHREHVPDDHLRRPGLLLALFDPDPLPAGGAAMDVPNCQRGSWLCGFGGWSTLRQLAGGWISEPRAEKVYRNIVETIQKLSRGLLK